MAFAPRRATWVGNSDLILRARGESSLTVAARSAAAPGHDGCGWVGFERTLLNLKWGDFKFKQLLL